MIKGGAALDIDLVGAIRERGLLYLIYFITSSLSQHTPFICIKSYISSTNMIRLTRRVRVRTGSRRSWGINGYVKRCIPVQVGDPPRHGLVISTLPPRNIYPTLPLFFLSFFILYITPLCWYVVSRCRCCTGRRKISSMSYHHIMAHALAEIPVDMSLALGVGVAITK